MNEFSFSDNQIKKFFTQNGREALSVTQWLRPNCALISFFISLSHTKKEIQEVFLSKTIIPWKKDWIGGFFIREFIPRNLSNDFRFITRHPINISPPNIDIIKWTLRNDNVESDLENIYVDDVYSSENMYWPVFMRLIEYVRSSEERKHLILPRIVDYLKKCWIKWSFVSMKWDNNDKIDQIGKIPENWLWWIGFSDEFEDEMWLHFARQHAHAILSYNKENKSVVIANPRYYNATDKNTTREVKINQKWIDVMLYIYD